MSALIKRRVSPLLIVILIAVLALGACAQAAPQTSSNRDYEKDMGGGGEAFPGAPVEAEQPAMEEAPAAPYDGSTASYNTDVAQQTAQERVVIKNGTLTLVVADPAVSKDNIFALAEQLGGYVVSSNQYKEYTSNGTEVPRVNVTIRVPAERMDEAMGRIKSESKEEPVNENISSQDVTNEYVDLQSRLKNLEAAEAELTQIMQDANRTEDVLSVYNQLVSIREQIEVIKGQINYYERSAAMSAISIDLIADAAVQPIEIGGWQPQGVAKDAVEALLRTMQGVANAAIWVVIYLLPVLALLFVIFVLPVILLVRYLRRRRQSQRAVPAAPPAE
jgi:hypothetical protein